MSWLDCWQVLLEIALGRRAAGQPRVVSTLPGFQGRLDSEAEAGSGVLLLCLVLLERASGAKRTGASKRPEGQRGPCRCEPCPMIPPSALANNVSFGCILPRQYKPTLEFSGLLDADEIRCEKRAVLMKLSQKTGPA
jgi:hypothetical protein